MAASRRIRISQTSRYVGTTVINDIVPGFHVWSLWVRPEIVEGSQDTIHRIRSGENSRLDILALRYYDDPRLWWVIADVNNIEDPLNIPDNTELRIPKYSNVLAALRQAESNR